WLVRAGADDGVHPARPFAEPPQPPKNPLGRRLELVERKLPAVDPTLRELLQDPERRAHDAAGVRVPAAERGDVLEAVLREEAQHLELRIDARLEASEDLQDQLLVEHDRRVRLLGADGARLE